MIETTRSESAQFRLMPFTVALAVLLSGTAQAGFDEWTTQGPFGGSISTLAIDPQTPTTLYAVAGAVFTPASVAGLSGVYRSTDAGAHWSDASDGLPDAWVLALAIDPQTPNTLYAGTDGAGIYRSTDAGAHWSSVNNGLPDGAIINALVVDPQTPNTLYAGTRYDGLYRSTDAGVHWNAANGGLPAGQILAVAIDPQNPNVLYAGTAEDGVYRSVDAGTNWSAATTGLPFRLFTSGDVVYAPIATLAINPQTPTTLYASTDFSSAAGSGRAFLSTDSGTTWSLLSTDLEIHQVTTFAIDPETPTILYAGVDDSFETRFGGVFRSTDGGAHWTSLRYVLPVLALAIDPLNPTILYTGTDGEGVMRSSDAGDTWNDVSHGIINTDVAGLAVDPQTPSTLYAGTYGNGVFKSLDSGATWNAANTGLDFLELTVRALAIDPQNPSTLYAGPERPFQGKLFRSTDGGAHWSDAANGLPAYDRNIYALTVDPQTPATLYAGGDFRLDDGTRLGVFKSLDGGSSWSTASDGLPTDVWAIAVDPQTSTQLYSAAGTEGVFHSTDAGAVWSNINNDLPASTYVWTLAIDPRNPSILYAGGSSPGDDGRWPSVFKSLDSGSHWSNLSDGLPDTSGSISALAIDPQIPTTVYAASPAGVFRSTNGGAHWHPVNNGLPGTHIQTLAIDPASPSTLYAGTSNAGVFDIQLVSGQRILALHNGRFNVEVDWRDSSGNTGSGTVAVVRPESDTGTALRSQDSAVSQFFSPDNWELLVKVLDGQALNDHFWVFLAAATNVEHTTTVTDTSCGQVRTYVNPLGQSSPAVTDTAAFSGCEDPAPPNCVHGDMTLCLGQNGRFQVDTTWQDFAGTFGSGKQVSITKAGLAKSDDSGLFYFFTENNWELLVKVLDGCAINDRFWVFAAGTTDVEYRLKVTDLESGTVQEYLNPLGTAADAITDTQAFATCP